MRTVRVCAVLALAILAGCGKKQPPAVASPPAEAPRQMAATNDDAAEREAAAHAAETARQREAERVRAILETRVFFDYDDSGLRSDTREALDAKVRVLRDNPTIRLRIEGHADERGTTEYNLALGARRADAVVTYIAGFGLAAARFHTVSYGEERPLDGGHDESAWGRNRRAEFVVIAGDATSSEHD